LSYRRLGAFYGKAGGNGIGMRVGESV